MGQVRTQLSWLFKGGSRTNSALSSYAEDLRALQLKVARIDEALQSLYAASNSQNEHLGLRCDQVENEVSHLKAHLRGAVDDLGDRIGAISERLNSQA
jgi:hypothetical protein